MFPLTLDLPELAARLRSGALDLHRFLDDLEAYFRKREPAVLAFVPEPQRFDRLHAAADALLAAFPDPAGRPPLFGIPLAVKDIFHVDGLPTHAGSKLPPALLRGPQAEAVTRLQDGRRADSRQGGDHRVRLFWPRTDAQSASIPATRPADRAAARPRRWAPGWRRWRWARRPSARSTGRPPTAAWSATSPATSASAAPG